MADNEATEEEMLKFALKFEQKPCVEQYKTCVCCFTCKWVYACYQTWRRGNIRNCRNIGVSKTLIPTWCAPVADRISEILGHGKKWELPRSHPTPVDRIEEWENEE